VDTKTKSAYQEFFIFETKELKGSGKCGEESED
jgi:hypothetical protein